MKKSVLSLIICLSYLFIFNQITAQNTTCDTVVLSSTGFNVNPLTNLSNPLKSRNTLTIKNTGCNNLRVRPEFIISHESQPLQMNDISSLKWQIPNVMAAPIEISSDAKSINPLGQIVGYFSGLNGDSTGNDLNINQTIGVEIIVKLRPNAPLGKYSAFWFTNSVDQSGNIIDTISSFDTTSLYYYNCNSFFIDSVITSNTSCHSNSDGSVDSIITSSSSTFTSLVLNSNNDSMNISNLNSGSYTIIVTDSFSGCSDTTTFTINSDSLNYEMTTTDINCFNANDGSATIMKSGYVSDLSPNNNLYCQMEPLYNFLQSIDTVVLFGEGDSIYNITTGLCDKYEDYSSQTATLYKGKTYNLKIGLNSCLGYYNDVASIFIDWNNDGDFDDNNELIDSTFKTLSPSSHNISITVPQNAQIGNTRMRIISNQDTARTTTCLIGSLNNLYWTGAVEDYSLSIVSTTVSSLSGGTPPYLVDWYGKDTNSLSVGFHKYSISDNGGCQIIDSIFIDQPDSVSVNAFITDINCYGDSSGSINLIINGGNPPFRFNWSSGDTTSNITNLSFGEYILTLTDSFGCSFVDTFVVNQQSQIITNKIINNVLCHGDSTGSVTISVSGGNPSYILSAFGTSLSLQDSSTFVTPQILPKGVYPFTITDSNQCVLHDSITISQNDKITYSPIKKDISCYGFSDGSVNLIVSGGVSPYIKNWYGLDTNNLPPGYHTFMISDSLGCIQSDSILVQEPSPISVNESISNVSCYGFNNGSASLNIFGGTAPYTQNWNGFNNNQLYAGSYIYSINDSNNCNFSDTIVINQPDSLYSTSILSDVLCHGDSTGSAILTIYGGTGPYNQNWFGVNNNSLSSGKYVYSISDLNGCTSTDSVIINQPDSISYTINQNNSTTCSSNDGTINIVVNGGISPYSYLWSTNDTVSGVDSLSAGKYYINFNDANNCIFSDSVTLSQPSNGLSLSLLKSNYNGFGTSCPLSSDGFINTTVQGGTGTISYLWSTNDSSASISNLFAGTYSLTIKDSTGCSVTDSVNLLEPSQITAISTVTDALCHGDSTGSAIVTFGGGVPDYLLGWSGFTYPLLGGMNIFTTPIGVPAGVYPFSVSDQNGCILLDTIIIYQPDPISTINTISNYNGYNVSCFNDSNANVSIQISGGLSPYQHYFNGVLDTSLYIDNLSSGNYIDSIVDANGCIFTDSVVINEPNEVTINLSKNDISCYSRCDGLINSSIVGGVPPYNYMWNNDSTLTNNSISNLCEGNYNLTVSDNNECQIFKSTNIAEPDSIIFSIDSVFNVSTYAGNDGFIISSVTGGYGSYIFSWQGPNGYFSNSSSPSNLYSGTYRATIIDSAGCIVRDSVFIDQPTSLTSNLDTIMNTLCYSSCDGSISIKPDGGDSIYFYFWTGPNGFISFSEDIDSLCAGLYTLFLSDNSDTLSFTYEVNNPSPLEITINADTITCYGDSAMISAYPLGGTNPYYILWQDSSTTTSTIVQAGEYNVKVTDNNGCTKIDSILISQPDSISLSTNVIDISCNGLSDGSLRITVDSGGTQPFFYSDDNLMSLQASNFFDNLGSGSITISVIDINNCTNQIIAMINEPSLIIGSVATTDASCYYACDGTATATIIGGTPPYSQSYLGNNPSSLCAGLYNLIITDNNGCQNTLSFTISEPNPVTVNVWQDGGTLMADSGFISYQWLDENGNMISGANTSSYTPESSGNYFVQVTDSNGCLGTSVAIYFESSTSLYDISNLISLYPNPSSGEIFISTSEKINKISISNVSGLNILEVPINTNKQRQVKLNLQEYSKGIYFVKISYRDRHIIRRFILQ